MPTTDAALEKQKQKVEKMREQVRDAEAGRIETEASLENDVTMAQLEQEEVHLAQELYIQKEARKVADERAKAIASKKQVATAGAPVVEAPPLVEATSEGDK